jgi:hypothetical protein
MKIKILLPLIAAAAIPVIVSGCASAHYVETGGRENVVSIGQINIQDYIQAACSRPAPWIGCQRRPPSWP